MVKKRVRRIVVGGLDLSCPSGWQYFGAWLGCRIRLVSRTKESSPRGQVTRLDKLRRGRYHEVGSFRVNFISNSVQPTRVRKHRIGSYNTELRTEYI